MKPFRQRHIVHPLLRHTLFGTVVLIILALGLYFLHLSGFSFELLPTAVNCLFFLACIYSGRWLCQAWYLRKRFVLFFIFSLLAILLPTVPDWILVRYAFHHPFAGFLELLRSDIPFFFAGNLLGMLLKLIRTSVEKELSDAQIKTAQRESELELLQAKLSPHFLFNVLNNLYGISIDEPKRMPPLILKLSSMLRYTVYGSRKQFIPLKEELEYIRTFIEFEQIRMCDRLRLVTALDNVNDPDVMIVPNVLIVFVENAFKHSKNTLSPEISIEVSLKIADNHICLEVSNSYSDNSVKELPNGGSSGVGLTNTIKRLDLLYGYEYELKQYTKDAIYYVTLRLPVKGTK